MAKGKKICSSCGTENGARTLKCSKCGFQFLSPKSKKSDSVVQTEVSDVQTQCESPESISA